jgi:hypothetical protein
LEEEMRQTLILVTCLSLALISGCDKKAATSGTATATATKSGASATTTSAATATTSAATAKTSAATTKTSAATAQVAAKSEATSSKEEKPYPGCIYKEDGSKEGECPSELAKDHGQLGGSPGAASATVKLAPGHYGMPFSVQGDRALSAAIVTAEADKDKMQRFTGTIGEVCQKKGCWFVLQDGTKQARVMMRDPKYFVIPIKSSGKTAILEGKLITKVFSEANVKHIEHDAGRDPSKVTGSRKEYVIMARSVKIDG